MMCNVSSKQRRMAVESSFASADDPKPDIVQSVQSSTANNTIPAKPKTNLHSTSLSKMELGTVACVIDLRKIVTLF